MKMKQMTLAAGTGFELHGRPTRKAEFLAKMEALMPWSELCALIEPHYPKAGNGRPPTGLERMLRMYWVANWFNLADEACEDAMYDIAYRGNARRERLKEIAPKAKDFTNKRAHRNAPLSDADKETNRRKSSIRAKVEHPFLILKRLWGFVKVRYRGLNKNANRVFAMLAAINLLKHGRSLTGEVRPA